MSEFPRVSLASAAGLVLVRSALSPAMANQAEITAKLSTCETVQMEISPFELDHLQLGPMGIHTGMLWIRNVGYGLDNRNRVRVR